jgi:hypothetical protein
VSVTAEDLLALRAKVDRGEPLTKQELIGLLDWADAQLEKPSAPHVRSVRPSNDEPA